MAKRVLILFFGDTARDRRVQNFSRYFSQEGWDVELLALTSPISSGPRKFFDYHRRIKKAVRSKQADIVLASDLYSLSAAAWMKKNNRAQLLLYDAREIYTELPAVAASTIKKQIWKRLEQQGMMVTDRILLTAPRDAQAICDVHGFLPRPILVRNLPWREPGISNMSESLERYGIPNGASVVIYLGGLQPARSLEKLIEAIGIVNQHLLLIGDGSSCASLESIAREKKLEKYVHFAGPIESEQALKIAAQCNVGISLVEPVSKSYELALPSKQFEYMMCGIPIVSSRLQQVMDLFPDEEWIAYVDERNPNSIANGIARMLEQSSNTAFRERERTLAREEYHFEHDAKNLPEVLQKFSI